MLTFELAKKIGIDACIDRLGRDFVMKYRDTSSPSYGDVDDYAYCFVGVDNSESRYDLGKPVLTSGTNGKPDWPYFASCNVHYDDGSVEFLECVIPT